MNFRSKRCKCCCCSEFFLPDYRNRDRQRYCGKADCRHASKRASQRRWFGKSANRDYFRGAENVKRVREWRQAHPGYWKPKTPVSGSIQPTAPESVNPGQSSCNATPSPLRALQDFCLTEEPGFIGLISMMTGRTLQEDIEVTARQVVERGRNILGLRFPNQSRPVSGTTACSYDQQTVAPTGSATTHPLKL